MNHIALKIITVFGTGWHWYIYVAKKFTFIRVRYINIKIIFFLSLIFLCIKKEKTAQEILLLYFGWLKIDNYGKVFFGEKLRY